MSMIRIEENRLFLLAQHEKGRRGKMGGIDRALATMEQRTVKREITAEKYALKICSTTPAVTTIPLSPCALFEDEDVLCNSSESSLSSDDNIETGPSAPKVPRSQTSRGNVDIMTPKICCCS